MKFTRVAAILALGAGPLLSPSPVLADTGLASSDPADGATLTEPPSEVVLTFEGEVSDDSSFTVTGPSGESVGDGKLDLDVDDRNVLRGDVSVSEAGDYVVAYTIVGEDGHPIEGEVRFTYAPPGSGGDTPNTAVPAPRTPTMTLVGVVLLVAAFVTAIHRPPLRR